MTERGGDGQAIAMGCDGAEVGEPRSLIIDQSKVRPEIWADICDRYGYDLVTTGDVGERERAARIAETAFDHMSPLAVYESYRGGDRPITHLNPEASARAIAAAIRGRTVVVSGGANCCSGCGSVLVRPGAYGCQETRLGSGIVVCHNDVTR